MPTLNGAYALFIDEFNEGATNFITVFKKFESMALSKKLLTHWKTRREKLRPDDEYDLVDEFADSANVGFRPGLRYLA